MFGLIAGTWHWRRHGTTRNSRQSDKRSGRQRKKGKPVIIRGPVSQRALLDAAEDLLPGREHPVPIDRQM